MDDLTEEGGLGELATHPRRDLRPKRWRDGVGDVETPAADPASQPVQHDVGDEVGNVGAGVVEFDQAVVPVAIMAVWAAVCTVIAVRFFKWE